MARRPARLHTCRLPRKRQKQEQKLKQQATHYLQITATVFRFLCSSLASHPECPSDKLNKQQQRDQRPRKMTEHF
ncbi:hypothetical protein ACLKA7_003045 [Drosophila subpalustris]